MANQTDKDIRERLIARGAGSLSDSELLSVILSSGESSGGEIALAEKILAEHTLAHICQKSLRDLRMVGGMGVRRAAVLSAAIELGRRMRKLDAAEVETIHNSDDVVRLFQSMLSTLSYEEFWVVYLNSAHRIVEKVKVSQGGVSGTVVDHKLIVKRAVELLSPAIVIVHNHPSGVASPSDEDKFITDKLTLAASLFDIQLLDHVIISGDGHFSFRANKLIE